MKYFNLGEIVEYNGRVAQIIGIDTNKPNEYKIRVFYSSIMSTKVINDVNESEMKKFNY